MKLLTKFEIACLAGLALTLIFGDIRHTAGVRDQITDNVLRLHILANSDSDEDQTLKLDVRDKILELCPELFDGMNAAEAADIARGKLDEITSAARKIIDAQGKDYSVTANITDMYFNAREYESFTMPAGNYTALRVQIGEAEGKNWWCVMYPPLCLPAAEEETKDYFDDEECDMLQNPKKYEVKFKILEFADKIKGRTSDKGKLHYPSNSRFRVLPANPEECLLKFKYND